MLYCMHSKSTFGTIPKGLKTKQLIRLGWPSDPLGKEYVLERAFASVVNFVPVGELDVAQLINRFITFCSPARPDTFISPEHEEMLNKIIVSPSVDQKWLKVTRK